MALESTQRFRKILAKSFWRSHPKEKAALAKRKFLDEFGRVDQIWPWLACNYGQVLALEAPYAAHPEKHSYSELAERISTAAVSFHSFGIEKGDVVALFSENSPRWLVADQGLMRAGAADAVRGASAPVEELRYILEDSGAVALVIQTAELWRKLAVSEKQQRNLKLVLQLEGPPSEGVIGWEEFISAGIGKRKLDPMQERGPASAAASVATILYTSGTTGQPKGVPLSHANLLHQMKSLACVAFPPPGSAVLSVLPIWHAYERSAEYYFFSCACTQSYTTIKQLKIDLPKVRPIVMATVPRLWEAIQGGFEDALKGMHPWKQNLLRKALSNSSAQRKAWRKFRELLLEPVMPLDRLFALLEAGSRWPLHALAKVILWPKVLKLLSGGRLKYPINGGGAIAPHVDEFFEAVGVELLVGYGLTETSPVVSCRRPWRNIRGTSGPPLPETEFRIVDPETLAPRMFRERGLVLVKGPQVMSGYLGKPEATAKVLDKDGWFDTGDLGMLLPDGSLVLTGRSKDTIVLSNGENIEPGPLEEALVSCELLDQVMLVGQDQRQLGALVVPNFSAIFLWAKAKGVDVSEDLGGYPGDEKIRKALRGELNKVLANRSGSRGDERIAGLAFVAPFTIENGLLTQTLKQRRGKIAARDEGSIAAIYGL